VIALPPPVSPPEAPPQRPAAAGPKGRPLTTEADVDQYLSPSSIFGFLAVLIVGLRTAVDWKNLRAVPPGKEALTREEYERDEKARKEQHIELVVKCRDNARGRAADRRRNDRKFDALVEGLNDLRVQLARLATAWEQQAAAETGASILKEKQT
jgi:hypothetical protein